MGSRTFALTFLAAVLASLAGGTLIARDPIASVRALRRASLALRGTPVEDGARIQLQKSWWDCGPAALRNLLGLVGPEPPALDSLVRLTGATRRGTTLGGMAAAAKALGYSPTLFRASPAHLDQLALPVIAWLDRRHFVVLAARADRDRFVLIDPEVGRYRIPRSALRRRWSGPGLRISRTR